MNSPQDEEEWWELFLEALIDLTADEIDFDSVPYHEWHNEW